MADLADILRKRVLDPAFAPYLCLGLLTIGFILDLNTEQAIVIAIMYNIPIAVSGALLSRRLTLWMIALSLLANVAAGWANSVDGVFESAAAFNRILTGLSFLIVGGMTLLFERSTEDVKELEGVEESRERERDLRRFLSGLSGPMGPDEMVQQATVALRELLQADAVVVTAVDGYVFAEPRWSAPPFTHLALPGKPADWAVDSLPVTSTPVITVRSDSGIVSVGRWRCSTGEDLFVVADRPARRRSSDLLGQAVEGLEPLRERAIEMDALRRSARRSDS